MTSGKWRAMLAILKGTGTKIFVVGGSYGSVYLDGDGFQEEKITPLITTRGMHNHREVRPLETREAVLQAVWHFDNSMMEENVLGSILEDMREILEGEEPATEADT